MCLQVHLQDPRTPAGMAEVPDALRRRLGWGLVHELRVTAGTLLLYPAWLYHAPLRSGRTDEWVTKKQKHVGRT